MRPADDNRKRLVRFFLVVGYLCVFGLVLNLCQRLGWVHVRLPGLTGFGARWGWVLGAALCFVLAWYVERTGRPT
jgi:hypothetical protein